MRQCNNKTPKVRLPFATSQKADKQNVTGVVLASPSVCMLSVLKPGDCFHGWKSDERAVREIRDHWLIAAMLVNPVISRLPLAKPNFISIFILDQIEQNGLFN